MNGAVRGEGAALEAGRELDALVAERVMGENLTPPRGWALSIIGAHETRVTGSQWQLRNGRTVRMPAGVELAQPEGTTDYNARYFAYAAEHGVDDLEAKVVRCRYQPKPYSTDISAAWEVVKKLRTDGWWAEIENRHDLDDWCVTLRQFDGPPWGIALKVADTAPLAICRAALAALATSTNSEAW